MNTSIELNDGNYRATASSSTRVRGRRLQLVALRHQLTVLRRQRPGPQHRYEGRAA
jgi:hypothetical protein